MPDEKQIYYKRPIWARLPEIKRDKEWVWFRKSASSTIQTSLKNVLEYEKGLDK
jgi:hypothetical protein